MKIILVLLGIGLIVYVLQIVFTAIVNFFHASFTAFNAFIHTLPGFLIFYFSLIILASIIIIKIYAKIRYRCGALDYLKWKIKKMKEEDESEIDGVLDIEYVPENNQREETKEKEIQKQEAIEGGIETENIEAEAHVVATPKVKERKEKFNITTYFERKEKAAGIIIKMEKIACELNSLTLDVSCLFSLKNELMGYYNDLIKLNEEDGVTMSPSPRSERDEILKNWPNTICDFIGRSVSKLRKEYKGEKLKCEITNFLSLLKIMCKNHGSALNENCKTKIEMLESAISSGSEFEYVVDFDLSVLRLLSLGKIDTYNVIEATDFTSSYDRAEKIISDMEFLKIISLEQRPIISYEKYFPMRPSLPKKLSGIEAEKSRIKEENERKLKRQAEAEEKERANKKLLESIGTENDLDVLHIDAMSVILAMEENIKCKYDYFIKTSLSPASGKKIFDSFKECCLTSKLPLAAEVRLESLLNEYEGKFNIPNPMYAIDQMEGHVFEGWCADLLKKSGFTDVEVTKGSGDQGVDVIAVKDGIRYAIQCKCYSSDLGNKPVQEVHAGKVMYKCQVGVVMTNRHFTAGAKELADATGVLLWDRDKLEEMLGM